MRNRDFSVDTLWAWCWMRCGPIRRTEPQLLFLDCSEEVLVRRYAETRRRHPLAPDEAPVDGIRRESGLLVPVRRRADILIDTSAPLSPNDLRTELGRLVRPRMATGHMGVTLQSFFLQARAAGRAGHVFRLPVPAQSALGSGAARR